ncbi:betaine-aldehyde dehydrogenase [Burkholderia multivorans]|nr:betaine-aldehyde dehydrogenase [Burkholderia multivorans]UQN57040.1 betaine-aldehyde dehydrogenase [Burkholderia multivorans]UQN62636.1 betaine-aldehyde dehydrogenase [Burkholderia multivorans]UQP70376.1 betaine-aldehyde dehydrogenase [Burkholderia multivorans]
MSPGLPLGSVCASDDGCAKSFDAMHEYIHAKSVRLDVDAQIPPYYPR